MTSRRHTLQARVLEYCRVNSLFKNGMRVMVAVSGGADSMVLLDCLNMGRRALGIDLVVGHVDHGLRENSDEDARFVLGHAASMDIDAVSRRVDAGAAARKGKLSIEDAARRVRYTALIEMAAEKGAELIATGHTATDQAETLLMRIVRGTGPLGLRGIEPARPDGLVRPLLCATRAEVRRYATERAMDFWEDPTNMDRRFLRNRVRLDLFPLLSRMNPRVEFTMAELAESAGELAVWVDRQASELVQSRGTGVMGLEADKLESVDPALLPYVVLAAFREVTGSHLGLSRTHIDSVVSLAGPGPTRECHLPRGVTVRRDRSGMWFEKMASSVRRRGPGPGKTPG